MLLYSSFLRLKKARIKNNVSIERKKTYAKVLNMPAAEKALSVSTDVGCMLIRLEQSLKLNSLRPNKLGV
jgi:hypothetical protein